jgi:hypothetical protein
MNAKRHAMKTIKIVGLALVLFPALVLAEKKPKVAEAINRAHTVYVQSADGEETKPGLAKEDMQAIANVRIALRNWGRYTFTDDRSKADLIFVVRAVGRRADRGDSGSYGGRSAQGNGSGMGAGGSDMPAPQGGQFPGQRENGAMNDNPFDVDRLEVCQLKPNGKLTGALWSRSMEGGLTPPRLLLFAEFKTEVEKAFPAPAAAPTPTAPQNQ